jgi:hypothetical protein
MEIAHKDEFIAYINALDLKPKTRSNYRAWVKRIQRYAPMDVNSIAVSSDGNIHEIARVVVDQYRRDHAGGRWSNDSLRSDARCILRHYGRFCEVIDVEEMQKKLDEVGKFDPTNTKDGKEKALRSIALRRGQLKFRRELLTAYERRCGVTGTGIEDVLEAAHIMPYNGESTNHVRNGLLLRSDIHALFDLHLLSIDPKTLRVVCSKQIQKESIYSRLNGRPIRLPAVKGKHPSPEALQAHFENRVP